MSQKVNLVTSGNNFQCDVYPKIFSSYPVENELWQVLETSNGTFKMFNAYYDTRKQSEIIILSFINVVNPTVKTYCQVWYEGVDKPIIVPAHKYQVIWYKEWGWNTKGSQPHLVSCKSPNVTEEPQSVSLVENQCEQATNNFKVIYNQPKPPTKKLFAVCTKPLDFQDDQSTQVIEWIEILSILGAEKIFIYVTNLHPNLMRNLQYFEKQGKVKVEKMTEPKGLPNRNESLQQWLQNDLISLNDCLYKHMYEYDFLIPLDIDEIIVPTGKELNTWKEMTLIMQSLEKLENNSFASYEVHNVFFLSDNNHEGEIQPEVPKDMFFLQNIYRAVNFSKPGIGTKGFQKTDRVVAMHNHFPIICFEFCNYIYVPKEVAQLSHYRRDCENYPKDECEIFKTHTVKDLTLWKYKDELIERVDKASKDLDLDKASKENLKKD